MQEIAKQAASEQATKVVTKVVKVVEKTPPPPLPALPNDCRKTETYELNNGDRLDVALLKSDIVNTKLNQRIKRCASNYDRIRNAHNANRKG